jgi:hypothetical protein
MATSQAAPNHIVPLHLTGNTTEHQNRQLQEFLADAAQEAYRTVIEQLDQQSAQTVLDMGRKLKSEVAERVVEIVHRHTVSSKYLDEEVGSNRVYPPTCRGAGYGAAQAVSRAGQLPGEALAQAAARGRGGLVRDSALAGAGANLQPGCGTCN